jgi:hypothetical protein
MQKSVLILCGLLCALLTGCGPHYFRPALGVDQPAEITVSAYTQDGCLENLEEEAKKRQVKVELKKIETELGWQILLFPYYKGYRCTGIVTEPMIPK